MYNTMREIMMCKSLATESELLDTLQLEWDRSNTMPFTGSALDAVDRADKLATVVTGFLDWNKKFLDVYSRHKDHPILGMIHDLLASELYGIKDLETCCSVM